MKKAVAFLGFLALCSASAKPDARSASNHVLVHNGRTVVPLVSVRTGVYHTLALSNSGPTTTSPDSNTLDEHQGVVGMNGTVLYGYLNGRLVGKVEVVEYRPGDEEQGIEEEVTVGSVEDQASTTARIFTSQPLPVAMRNPPRKATQIEIAVAQNLTREALQRRRVPETLWPRALKTMVVQPIHVRSGEPEILLILGNITVAGKEGNDRALGFLLIAERQTGEYQLTLNKVHWPGLVCAEKSWDFLDHADFDSDGTDELVLEVWGWESWRQMILRRVNGQWKRPGYNENEWPSC